MSNALLNGSFKQGWYHADGIPELQIPNDWHFDYADETVENPIDPTPWSKFQRPEVRVLPRDQLPVHEQDLFILDGDHVLKVFKDSGAFQCTFSQKLKLQSGHYDFTVKVFADLIKGYEDDGSKIWADDAAGQDGLIRYVLKTNHWTNEFYGDWLSLTPSEWNSLTFKFYANADTTIGVSFMCPFPLANSGLFCDAWTLERIEEPKPRQYDRVVHLLPQDATAAEIAQVVKIATLPKQTITWSVDDAFVTAAALKTRTVNVWDVTRITVDQGVLEEWVERFYPPLPKIYYRYFAQDPAPLDWQRYLLWQCEPEWRGKYFGSVGYQTTFCKEGCYVTVLASAMRFYDLDADATPVSVDAALGTEGYIKGTAKVLWNASRDKLGIGIREGMDQDAADALSRGDIVMAEVQPADPQHFVLVVERFDDGDWLMLDPYKNIVAPLYDRYQSIKGWRILSPVDKPQPPPPKPPRELLTLHLQTPVPGWLDYVAAVKPAWVKLVGGFEAAREIKAVSPETKVLIRQHSDDSTTGAYLDNPDKRQAAGHFLDRFWDAIVANAPYIDAAEELNETIPSANMMRIQQAVDFAVAFADELMARCEDAGIKGVVPCLLNTAVGNPQHGYETEKLLPAAEAAVRYGGFLGYHSYFPAHVDHAERWLEEEGFHHHMRALDSWDVTFAKHGLEPTYLFTEMGAVGMTVREDGRPGAFDRNAGWRAALDGDLARYIRLLIRFRDMVNEWNATHDNRAEALQIFTTGIGIGWSHFILGERELVALAKALREG